VLKPSAKIAYPDIKVGIPSVLLAIEMSIFAVMHIFAFSAKPYDIRDNPDPAAAYEGGSMGWKAILEAFNIWDIVKASARGFRWLFVGSRKREQDISYEGHRRGNSEPVKMNEIRKDSPPPGYDEELAGAGRVDTNLGKENARPTPIRRETNESDDQAALLSNPQSVPKINLQQPSSYHERDSSPYREDSTYYQDDRPGPGGPRTFDARR
jgi:hypothetical protein